ncbi:hypothetical protein PEM_07720 [Stenotrophomonas sp. Pemsol]|nr:hypothetical protein PEM_07720 [Stenotrophomonas sp. Pemsol]PZS95271.1 hypothetical protein A7X90_10030 [Stenotrophomonas maltophilia]PZT21133.1 hypothetical protein A7X86_07360 [Stenotrophomonas maltophilia]PZT39852.1 hypothetical protein A7X99_10100 [Stenotrophomonas maltophilia]
MPEGVQELFRYPSAANGSTVCLLLLILAFAVLYALPRYRIQRARKIVQLLLYRGQLAAT